MKNRRRGFTIVELGVVCIVLVAMTAIVLPNMLAIKRSRESWQFEQGLQRLVASASEEAINRNSEMVLTFDDGNNQFVLSVEAQDPSSTGVPIGTTQPVSLNGNSQDPTQRNTVRSVKLPAGVTVQQYQKAGKSSNAGEWEIHFYPDATSDGGGVELSLGGASRTLYIDPRGTFTYSTKALPEPNSTEWPAGDYERRA
jgi:type II secretory pathway pseudopilin PulG